MGRCLPLIVLLAIVISALWGMVHVDEGFVYPLDDSYIHLSLARNLAESGVWGLTPDRYAFCSSSPLWSVALAGCFRLWGYSDLTALFLSLIFCIATMSVVDSFFHRHGFVGWRRLLMDLAFLIVSRLPVLGLLGMEHSLHMLLVAIMVDSGFRIMTGRTRKCESVFICGVIALLPVVRYESFFLIIPFCVLLFFHGHRKLAVSVVICSWILPLLYGTYSVLHGGWFLPNTLLIKGGSFDLDRVIVESLMPYLHFDNRTYDYFILMSATVLAALFHRRSDIVVVALIGLFTAEMGHHVFVGETSFMRYQGYVSTAATMLLLPIIGGFPFRQLSRPRKTAVFFALLLFALPFLHSFFHYSSMLAQGSSDVQCQQIQMAKIFASIDRDMRGAVAVNDIGIMSLRSGIPILDLVGLADGEVASLVRSRQNFLTGIRSIASEREVKYMAVFNGWFPKESVPQALGMIPVGCLVNLDNYVCAEPSVMLYASDALHAQALEKAMRQVEPTLPGSSKLVFNDKLGADRSERR